MRTLALLILTLLHFAAGALLAQEPFQPKAENTLPGRVSILTPGGSRKNVVVPEGTQGQITIHYHDTAGAGTTRVTPLSSHSESASRTWLFEFDFANDHPAGASLLSILFENPSGLVAAPILRNFEIPLSDKPAIAHPHLYAQFWATSRLLDDVKVAPLSMRIRVDEIVRLGVDPDTATHGVLAYPIEFLLATDTEEVFEAQEATVDPLTAEYFGSDDFLGLGGKFIEFAKPCKKIQVYLDEPASIWGHWVGSPHDRKYEPTHWKLAYQSAAGIWEVAAEGNANRNEASDVLNSPVTLTRMIELPEGTTRIMFVAFADREKPMQLGMKPACPVDLPR